MASKLSPILAGVAGEYLVAAELTRLGYVASITLRNTRGIDILASNPSATKSVGIQVKTIQSVKPSWVLSARAEDYHSENLFYVLVTLPEEHGQPGFHIVPSRVVADYIKMNHKRWLGELARDGTRHKDTPMRKFVDADLRYKDKWDLLQLD